MELVSAIVCVDVLDDVRIHVHDLAHARNGNQAPVLHVELVVEVERTRILVKHVTVVGDVDGDVSYA